MEVRQHSCRQQPCTCYCLPACIRTQQWNAVCTAVLLLATGQVKCASLALPAYRQAVAVEAVAWRGVGTGQVKRVSLALPAYRQAAAVEAVAWRGVGT